MYETQKERMLIKLKEGRWVCVTEFMADYIPDYRRRLCDLKDDKVELECRKCETHRHRGGVQEWRLKQLDTLF